MNEIVPWPASGFERWFRLLTALLLVGPASVGVPANAGSLPIHELKLGVLNHDTDGLWSGTRREHGPDLNVEIIFEPSLELWSGLLRPAAGVSINTRGDTSKVYAYGRWERAWRDDWFTALGLGVTLHDGARRRTSADEKALGSHLLFHTALEAGYVWADRYVLSVYFDHMSNAGLASRNEGMDTLGLRYGIRF